MSLFARLVPKPPSLEQELLQAFDGAARQLLAAATEHERALHNKLMYEARVKRISEELQALRANRSQLQVKIEPPSTNTQSYLD